MDDKTYKFLVRTAIVMGLAWVGWTIYDGFFTSTEPHSSEFSAAARYFKDGLYDEALTEYQEILSSDRDNIRALGGKAQALMQMRRHAEALALLDQLLAREPEYAPAYVSRGILKDRMGDYEGALADYERSLSLDAEVAEGPGLLTRFLRNQAEKPPTVADRAGYLREQLAKPESERVLRMPEEDVKQRSYEM